MKRSILFLSLFVLGSGILFSFFPYRLMSSLTISAESLLQFVIILPAIILLMGIFTVLVTPQMIERNFGTDSGFRGNVKALLFGALMSTGPIYLAFPMAKRLLDKGAKISAIVIFVASWNGIGIIAEIVEVHYMGLPFMAVRLALNALFILLAGYGAGFIYEIIGARWKTSRNGLPRR